MSKAALAIALVLLIALAGAGAILLTKPSAPTDGPVRLLPTIPPERVTHLSIDDIALARDDRHWRDADGWPVDQSALRALLRSLSGLNGPASDGALSGSTRRITITTDQDAWTLLVDAIPFAGRTIAELESGAGPIEIDAELLTRLPDSDRAWLERSALPGLEPQSIARLVLERDGVRTSARRLGAAWFVELAPDLEVRAHRPSLVAIAEHLRTLRVDDVSPTDGTERPAGALSASIEENGETYTLAILTPAGARTHRASVTIPGARAIVTLPDIEPATIPVDPIVYAARTASSVLATDVRTIVVDASLADRRRFTRSLDGFVSASDETVLPGDAQALLDLITSENGIPGRASDAVFTPMRTITLLGYDDGVLDTIEIGYTEGPTLALRSSSLIWAYPRAAPPRLLRLAPPSTD